MDAAMKLEIALRNAVKNGCDFTGEASAFGHVFNDRIMTPEEQMERLAEIINETCK